MHSCLFIVVCLFSIFCLCLVCVNCQPNQHENVVKYDDSLYSFRLWHPQSASVSVRYHMCIIFGYMLVTGGLLNISLVST